MKRRMDHTTPPWLISEPTFFVTINAVPRGVNHLCKNPVGTEVLAAIQKYHDDQRWFCSLALLMPDHVHMLVTMSPVHDLTKTMGNWKRWLAAKRGLVWQENFFEHRLRKDESEEEKGQYILANPVRAGFVEKPDEWGWVWNRGWVNDS